VLPAKVSAMLMPLRALIFGMDQRDRLPQIELAIGQRQGGAVIALVLRHLEPLSAADQGRLLEFAAGHGVQWWLQPKGPESVRRLDDEGPPLDYALPEFGVRLPFVPTDFTQINASINGVLVAQALRLLQLQGHERVIDWFCGLGNFSLPLATRAAQVLGVEGSPALVQRARDNAVRNGLSARTRFEARDLFAFGAADLVAQGPADRWLVDPPREGAFALAKALADLHAAPVTGWTAPRRIVYVSCNPATLARDAGLLVHQAGYRCAQAGMVNMFPHTAHVESMAVFEREGPT
jgi:23S rRNA (uracil1939-C5)-methyltransferase